VSLRSLAPPGPATGVGELIERLDLAERPELAAPGTPGAPGRRPYVALNMISTADGRATLSGRSGTIGGEADRQLFHGLRTVVDAVMAGAGTVRAEGYHRLIRDPAARERRRERGLAGEPLACVVSGRLALGAGIPLLEDPEAHVAILTASPASLPAACRAQIEYVRCVLADGAAGGDQPRDSQRRDSQPRDSQPRDSQPRDSTLDLAAAMRELRGRFGVRTLLCEGGPHLNAHLLAAGLVDELFLSLAPALAGGDTTEESLRIVSGPGLDPPVTMELVSAHEHESHLFLRYRINR
jgi:riboflavin biosynthesis pyrimidine reductase